MRQRSLAVVRSCQRLWHRGRSECDRSFSTDRPPVEFRVFRDTVRHMPEGQKLMAGNLVEFRRHRDLMLGIVNGQRQHKWVVHDQVPSMSHAKHSLGNVQDGRIFHVRGQDVSLVLPGTHYSRSDIALFVENAKGANAGCVEVAWQTMDATSRPLSLSEMANLLLKDDSPMGIYTTYALLKVDRRFFRQVDDLPWNVCCLWKGMYVDQSRSAIIL